MVSFVGFSFILVPSQEIVWEERLRNDLFCVEWDVKPLLRTIPYCVLDVSDGMPMHQLAASCMLCVCVCVCVRACVRVGVCVSSQNCRDQMAGPCIKYSCAGDVWHFGY